MLFSFLITGIVDDQMDGVLRLVSVVALYAGRPEMLDKVEEVVTVTQNSDTSISVCLAAARYACVFYNGI